MSDVVNKEFIQECREVAQAGKPFSLTVRELIRHFGQERRGREVIRSIKRKLRSLGLETEPQFDEVHIDSAVRIIPRPARPVGRPPKPDDGAENAPATPAPQFIHPASIAPAEEAAEESRRPYQMIGNLEAANRKPHTVRASDDLMTVITLLLLHKISHVPVMQNERNPEGVVSWRSIGQARAGNRTVTKAGDCMERVPTHPQSAFLFDAVRDIIHHGVILVQAQDKTICGLVTAKDITEQFVGLSQPFLLLEQIENHLRDLLTKARLTQQELQDLVDPSNASRKTAEVQVDELTFGEYLRGLSKPELWGRLKLGIDRSLFVRRLDDIRKIRNSVMHFHPDGIEPADLECLSKTREMLQRL